MWVEYGAGILGVPCYEKDSGQPSLFHMTYLNWYNSDCESDFDQFFFICYVLQQSNRFFMISSKLILMVRFNKTKNSLSLSSSESKSEPNTNKNLIMRLAGLSTWPCLLRTKPSEDIKTRQDKIYFGQTSHKNTSIVKKIEDKRLHLSVKVLFSAESFWLQCIAMFGRSVRQLWDTS